MSSGGGQEGFFVVASLHYSLHWLPNSSQIQNKMALICFCIVSGTAPTYLLRVASSLLLHLTQPSIFCAPGMGRRILGEKSFKIKYIRPVIWNSLYLVKTENQPLLHTDLSFSVLLSLPTHHQ